jgi:hypothetical protein
MRFWKRLKYYFRKEKFDRELAEEMQFHMEMKAARAESNRQAHSQRI